jgi:ubiquinone/menaquinone biosynthesis C-methylase UbiE
MTLSNPAKDYFDQIAPNWQAMQQSFFSDAVRQVAIDKSYLHPGMDAADIGAGAGFISQGVAPLVSSLKVVDASPQMLQVARQNLAAYPNITYHLGTADSLPLEPASLDVIFANMMLHHCPNPLASIKEMARLLRPGGRLTITDLDAHTHEELRAEMADTWLGFNRADLRDWFEQAGLVNVLVDCTGQDCHAPTASIGIFIATGTKKITAQDAVQQNYAARALGDSACCAEGSSCCSPGIVSLEDIANITWNGGYADQDTAGVPSEAAEFSLGCGNPLAMATLRPGETVLDIGSGGGLDSFIAAKRVGPTGRVIGVDMTPAMLQRARESAKNAGFTNITFRHGVADKLPVSDASVDVIISNCVINLTEDKAKVFSEAFRVLSANGRLEVNDVVFGGNLLPASRTNTLGWSECISGALPEQEYLDLVRQAGFSNVTARRSTSHGTSSDGVPVYSVQVSAVKGEELQTSHQILTKP